MLRITEKEHKRGEKEQRGCHSSREERNARNTFVVSESLSSGNIHKNTIRISHLVPHPNPAHPSEPGDSRAGEILRESVETGTSKRARRLGKVCSACYG